MVEARLVETVNGQVICTTAHDRMTAWACVNAIMEFNGDAPVLFGEWRDAIGDEQWVNPTDTAKLILKRRAQ